jgi:hypothetical protein
LPAVELGGQLVAATLPALRHLLDRVADGLVAVQLTRPGTTGRAAARRRLPADGAAAPA